MGLRIASWVQKSLVSGSPQFTRTAPIEVEPPVQFFGEVTILAPHSNPAGSGSRSIMAVLFEDESGAVVDNAHPRAGDIPWGWTTGVGGGRWYSYIHTDDTTRTITVPQGLRLSLVGLWGWDDSSTARTVGAFTVEGSAVVEAQVARYARPDGTLAPVGEARVWDGQWRTIYESWKPRSVAVTLNGGDLVSNSGDTDLIQTWNTFRGVIVFTVPVIMPETYDKPGGADSGFYPEGGILPAGTSIQVESLVGTGTRTLTFVEARP